MRASTRRKKTVLRVGGSREASIASTCKAALAVFAEYSAHHKLAELKAGNAALTEENAALKRELALHGTAVGCVDGLCSSCDNPGDHCDCKAWTCRCYRCWVMRRVYMVVHGEQGAHTEFRMVDDRADNKVHTQRLVRERAETDNEFDADLMDTVLNSPYGM